jgi:glycerophosphoryl diester phosphodiesterase
MHAVRGKVGLNSEVKKSGLERKVCELLRSRQMMTTSMVSSFDWKALEKIRALDSEIRFGLLSEEDPDILIDAATAMRAFSVNPRLDKVNAAFCDKAHARGLKVLVWTVDSPGAMQVLISFGVDGIITNYPRRLRDLMAGR